jgi:hypothetical protein
MNIIPVIGPDLGLYCGDFFMAEPYAEVNQYMLVSAFKKAARQYLFSSNQYDREDCTEFMIDAWEEVTDYYGEEYDVPKRDLGGLDNQNDPVGILRAYDSLVQEFRKAQIIEPDLQKIIQCIRDFDESSIDAAECHGRDLMAAFSRRILGAIGAPVPGRLRVMLANWGLAPQ